MYRGGYKKDEGGEMNKKSVYNSYFVFVGIIFCIWGISTYIFEYLHYPSFIGWGVFISLFIPTLIFYFERLDNVIMNEKGRIFK